MPLAEEACYIAKSLDPTVLTVYRDYRVEHPTGEELASDPVGYLNRAQALWPPGFDYYEIMNEWAMPDELYAVYAEFLINLGAEATARGTCILGGGFAPGQPELKHWVQLVPFLRWANDHPCGVWPDGTPKYHGISWHAAGYYPDSVPQWPWVNWIWVAGRFILANQEMRAQTGFGLQDFFGPKLVTEMGYTDGYADGFTGRNQHPSCEQIRLGLAETQRVYEQYAELVDGYHYWNVGQVGHWTDDSACFPYALE